jgi:hypothetical protein
MRRTTPHLRPERRLHRTPINSLKTPFPGRTKVELQGWGVFVLLSVLLFPPGDGGVHATSVVSVCGPWKDKGYSKNRTGRVWVAYERERHDRQMRLL